MSRSKPINVPAALAACGLLDVEVVENKIDTWMWGPLIFVQRTDGAVYIDVDAEGTSFEERGPFFTHAQLKKGVKTLLHEVVKYGLAVADLIEGPFPIIEKIT